VEGVHRFLTRLWRLKVEVMERTASGGDEGAATDGPAGELLRKAHWAIDKVTRDIERDFGFNTAIAAVMELTNDAYRLKDDLYGDPAGEATLRFATQTAASILFPFAPHLGAEVYEALTERRVWEDPWPKADPALLASDVFTLVVQVNGKRRAGVEAPAGASRQELLELAHADSAVRRHIDGKEVVKEIVVPGKLVNLVVR
jgi:leucyl-tRNA synthetase